MTAAKEERDVFIQNNLGLVHACAGRFRGRGIEYDDLYGAGCVGLIKACDGFDCERGVRFSTYAVPVILGEIKKLFRDGGSVKVSRSLKELGLKINILREKAIKENGAEPGVEWLAEQLDSDPDTIALAIQASLPAISLTPDNDEDAGREWDIPVESPEGALADKIGLETVMAELPEEDQLLLRLRFFREMTQAETAKQLHTTQVQISRRERKLLAQMRNSLLGEDAGTLSKNKRKAGRR